MRSDIDARKNEIIGLLEAGATRASVCRLLNCKPETLTVRLIKWGKNHLKNQGGKKQKVSPTRLSALQYIKIENPSAHKARKKLIEDGIKEHACENCGIREWCGMPTPLELDHKDGNRYNWSYDNLWIICPNCHAQRPTNSGSNVGSYG